MHRLSLLALALAAACGNTDAPGGSGTENGAGSTSEAGESTGFDPTTGASAITASATSDPSTSGTGSAEDSSTTDGPAASSSESTGCPIGTEGCPCDADACLDDLVCADAVCTAPGGCDQDLLEPNDEETMPTLLGEVDDDDDDGGSIFGTLEGPDDVDWYRYTGNDTVLGNVDPARFVMANAGLRICKFAECEGGVEVTEFDCPAETEAATSPEGRPGCCAPMGIALADANCTGGLDDTMQVFLRVDQAEAACVDYELIYHF